MNHFFRLEYGHYLPIPKLFLSLPMAHFKLEKGYLITFSIVMTRSSSKYRKLSKSLLEEVNNDELRYVVRQYAQRDKSFNDYLMLRFLHLLPSEKPSKKYAAFLSSYLRKYLDRPDKINSRTTKSICRSLEELRQQGLDLASTKNFIESYGIFINLLLYCSLLIEKTSPNTPEELMELEGVILQSFSDYLDLKIPRPLLTEIEEDLKGLILTGSIRLFDARLNPLDLLLQRADSDARRRVIIKEFIDYSLKNAPSDQLMQMSWLALLYQSLKYEFEDILDYLLGEEILSTKKVLETTGIFIREGKYSKAEMLIKAGQKKDAESLKASYLEMELMLSRATEDYHRASNCILQLIKSRYTDPKSLRKILHKLSDSEKEKITQSQKWPDYLEEIYKQGKPEVLAALLMWLEDYDRLFELLTNFKETNKLMPYNKVLYENKSRELTSYYKNYVDKYLSHHIGKLSIRHLDQLLDNLRKSNVRNLADQLNKYVRKKYNYRSSINKGNFGP